jgi:hypothetical protein
MDSIGFFSMFPQQTFYSDAFPAAPFANNVIFSRKNKPRRASASGNIGAAAPNRESRADGLYRLPIGSHGMRIQQKIKHPAKTNVFEDALSWTSLRIIENGGTAPLLRHPR